MSMFVKWTDLVIQSFPCHSERSKESSPFVERKGVKGMLIPSSPLDGRSAR